MSAHLKAIADTVGKLHGQLLGLAETVAELHGLLDGQAAATVPAGTEPADQPAQATEPAGTEPAGTEPAGTEPAGTEPVGTEPADQPAQATELPPAVIVALQRLAAGEPAATPDSQEADDVAGTAARLHEEVTAIIGGEFPGLRTALTGIGVIARHGRGLGRIDRRKGAGDTWLRRFGEGEFESFWHELLDQLRRFAETCPDETRCRRLVELDMLLRTLVPADFRDPGDGHLVSPALAPPPWKEWLLILDGCAADMLTFCDQRGFRAGHVPPGITVLDAQQNYHVDDMKSLRQPVAGSAQARVVLWSLRAWSGKVELNPARGTEKLLKLEKARVVYTISAAGTIWRP